MRIGLSHRLRMMFARLLPATEALNAAAHSGIAGSSGGYSTFSAIGSYFKNVPTTLAAEHERWLPWCVVAFAGGILLYFSLAVEPSLLLASSIGLAALFCALLAPRSGGTTLRFLCVLVAAAGLGFATAKFRTVRVAAPAITRDTGPVEIVGRIESLTIRAPNRARIVLAPEKFGKNGDPPPHSVRLTLIGAKAVAAATPGALVSVLAMVRPPPEPAMPHGYDFARWAYFHGIGGVGFTYGAPKPVEMPKPPGFLDRTGGRIEKLRLSMAARISAAVPGTDGEIAAALVTGERGEIDEEDVEAYRDSGLAHVLSISGLHLALAGLGVFWVVRALFALWPWLALTQPIKKWAAVAALMSASFYLAISGGGAPAVRSYLMLSMMLLGVLADRPALSMRAVALAALALLVFQPEGIIEPGFQMSFAAVTGLIALAEWGSSRPRDDEAVLGRFQFWWRKGRRYLIGMVLASVVATLATTPFAIFHFDRASVYSLLANFLAEPVVAFVIMPFAAISVVMMPFGLETGPLQIMGSGVHWMTAIARYVSGLPGATALVPTWPSAALIAIVFGGLWIALWRLRWRWLGLIPIAAAFVLIFRTVPPDLLIARDGQSIAVRGGDGRLMILGTKPDEYTASQWLLRDGDRRDVATARAITHCDEQGCVETGKGNHTLALSLRASALVEDCKRAEIVVSAVPIRRACDGPKLVLDRFDMLRQGATAVTFEDDRYKIETVAAERGARPWSAKSGN